MHLGRERGDMKALDYFPSQETEREECKREEKAEGGLHSNCSELEVVVFTGELQNPPHMPMQWQPGCTSVSPGIYSCTIVQGEG